MASHSVLVSCRLRHDASEREAAAAVGVGADGASVVLSPGSGEAALAGHAPACSFAYLDAVFPPAATQERVFAAVGAPFVADVLAGYDCTILAYGQTGSGKTHTVVGGAGDARGLAPRAMELLLTRAAELSAGGELRVSLSASFVEVYREKLRDLLLPLNSSRLRLREDKRRGVWLDGATSVSVDSLETGVALLARGAARRATGSTAMNADSSRSHSVLLLTLTTRSAGSDLNSSRSQSRSRSSSMSIVDLAGSERAQKTSASGERLEEAKHINKSLSALGNVINALADGRSRHVPYRDSVLTRLLQNSLGGSAKTHLVLTASSSATHVDETLSTLRFGARAKRVSNSPRANALPDDAEPCAASGRREDQRLIRTLRDKVESLACYIRELEASRCARCRLHLLGGAGEPEPWRCRCSSTGSAGAADADPALTTREEDGEAASSDASGTSDLKRQGSGLLISVASGDIADSVLQAEMRDLRTALAELAASNGRSARAAGSELSAAPDAGAVDAAVRRQVTELEAQIDRLTAENDHLSAANQRLSAEVARLGGLLRLRDEGDAAEADILRRRLDKTETRAARLETELAASLRSHDECRALLAAKQREASDLQAQLQQRQPPALGVADGNEQEREVSDGKQCKRKPSARPFTADERGSSPWRQPPKPLSGPGEHSGQSGAGSRIQSWWSGGDCADNPSPFESAGVPRRCGSSSEAVRPMRVRLVGLLASLEEETSAFRGLLATESLADPAADSARENLCALKSGRRLRGLPALVVAAGGTSDCASVGSSSLHSLDLVSDEISSDATKSVSPRQEA